MSMRPVVWPEPDPLIASAIAGMYGSRKTERPLAVAIRDRLGQWLADEDFTAAFGVRGKPGWAPSRLALVTVLQRAERLTDRLAAEAVRTRIDWKYLLGLAVDDPGFDHTVLAKFRAKVAAAGLEHLITHVATTDATVTDNQMTGDIHDQLAGKALAPGRHYLDSGYLSAALVVAEAARHGIALIGPLLADTSAQARAGNGYARADFTIDYDTESVTCPQGATAASWTPCTQRGKDAIVVHFATANCAPCPAKALCAKGKYRTLTVPPRDLAEAQAAARAEEKTIPFQADHARRAGVEGTIHQAASHGARRARYRGLPKTRLDHIYLACALNLLRLHAYWTGTPLDRRRTSHLARLELALAA